VPAENAFAQRWRGISLTDTQVQPRTRRLLHVPKVITAAFKYVWKDGSRLIMATLLACLLASATRLLLEWLVFPWPPRLPNWLLFDDFDPPTWLMAFALTPWLAMGWAFVLDEMEVDKGRRGTLTIAGREQPWLRFELSRPIWIAAAIFTVVNVIDALTRFAQFQILLGLESAIDPSELTLTVVAALLTVLRVAVMVGVFVWCYPLAGMVLRDGTFSIARLRAIMAGNWLRVGLIFLVLSIILRVVYRLIEPITSWLIVRFADSDGWSLPVALIRFALDFPFQMLWIVSWAVIVGVVLYTLDPRPDGRTDIPA
jgi:hypothetical protein